MGSVFNQLSKTQGLFCWISQDVFITQLSDIKVEKCLWCDTSVESVTNLNPD